jgi:dGTP triphosphohydrolase
MFVTVYTKKVKRRATGKVETVGCTYATKSLTAMHAHIRACHGDAQTYQDPARVITDFIPGMNLRMRPMVVGGTLVK